MSELNPEAAAWNALRGVLVTRALAIVADLRVADALADGERGVAELASELGADADALHRILRALASDGFFAESEPGVFRNTPSSELLRDGGWRSFAHLFGGIWMPAVAALDASGRATFPQLNGAGFWDWLGEHPGERAEFDRAMEQGWEGRLRRLESIGWHDGETVVDVGGGNGSLLLELLARQPGLRGIVFDLPETVRDESTYGDRCVFVAGSFFDRVPQGDVYLLSTILHDWDDESAARILRTIRTSADESARLVLLEGAVEQGNDPQGAKWLDLLMLTLFEGRERTEAQWRTLIGEGGFVVERVGDGVIEARCR